MAASQHMREIALIAAVASFAAAAQSGTPPFFQILMPHGKIIDANGYHLDLGDADDAAAPGAWQGPIRISRAGRSACTVSNDVSIIEPPIRLVRHDIFYVSTFYGRENRIYAIDAGTCAVRWTSPLFTGQSTTSRRFLILPGAGAFPIGLDAIPQPVTARETIDDPPPIEVPPVIVHRKARRAFTLAPTWAQVPPATDRTRSRDPITGAVIGQFGGAYQDASPLRVLNPALKDPDLPNWWVR